jgi:hypothetical protein
MSDRRTLRAKPKADLNLVNLSNQQYCEPELESEHPDAGQPVKKIEKRKPAATTEKNVKPKRQKAPGQQGGSKSTLKGKEKEITTSSENPGAAPGPAMTPQPATTPEPSQVKRKVKLSALEVARERYMRFSIACMTLLTERREQCGGVATTGNVHPISSHTFAAYGVQHTAIYYGSG